MAYICATIKRRRRLTGPSVTIHWKQNSNETRILIDYIGFGNKEAGAMLQTELNHNTERGGNHTRTEIIHSEVFKLA